MLFRVYTNGVPLDEAGVNGETAPTTEFATFAQTLTGVAYANPSPTQSATITFTVYDNSGTLLGSQSVTLGPLAHGASNIGPLLGLPKTSSASNVPQPVSREPYQEPGIFWGKAW